MKQIIINESDAGQRLDKYLNKLLKDAGKSFIYKMLRKKNITLNEKKADGSEHLKAGDEIRIFFSDETFEKFAGKPEPIQPASVSRQTIQKLPPVKIIYQDDDIMIVNKPSGLLSQKAASDDISLNEYLLQYLLKKGKVTKESIQTFRPSICNRLDRNTSGIVTAGITYRGARELSRLLRERTADKRYLALVKGVIRKPEQLRGYLIKDEKENKVSIVPQQTEGADPIETDYIPLGDNGRMTLLEIHLITGKSHQIRAHLSSIGHPVIGDNKYGEESVNGWYHRTYHGHYQLLHSWKLSFPKEGCQLENLAGKTFKAALPENFVTILSQEGFLKNGNLEQ